MAAAVERRGDSGALPHCLQGGRSREGNGPLRSSLARPGPSFLFRGVQTLQFRFRRLRSETMKAGALLISAEEPPSGPDFRLLVSAERVARC